MGLINNIFNSDKKYLNIIKKDAEKVNSLAEEYSKLTNDELRAKTTYFKKQLDEGKTLDDIKIEAFATVREAAKRVLQEYPFISQIEGACVLHNGDIAEMNTGSGKTLTATMPVYLNALSGKGVHVITVNEYLAERDSKWMGQVYRFLGLTVGLNLQNMYPFSKKEAYNCDITYTTASELGFDYLRDNMVTDINERVLRGLNYAVVDEADSILIDDARTPLIISGQARNISGHYLRANNFAKTLKASDYTIDLKLRTISLTEQGIKKAEKYYGVENFYAPDNSDSVHFVQQALKANYLFHKNVDYVIEDGVAEIIDPNTGRKMPGREWSDGLHQAIQAKEGIPIKEETTTVATITYQNFFRLYNKLAGMTGTAKTEEEELLEIYNMRVIVVPPNKPVIRDDKPDLVFATKKAKYKALVEEVKRLHEQGRPVLLGTIAIETSEVISDLLTQNKIPHEVLNAKNHAREAEIIALAGQKGQVTIATNMAGRGTDIKLGEGVLDLGGLAVLGSERHESRRIDNQLRGRSGRQGDPGSSQFFVSLEDDLMARFGSEKVMGLFSAVGTEVIENVAVTKAISSAQARIEGFNYDSRKAVMDYDTVVSKQRETIYKERNFILEHEDIRSIVNNMYRRSINLIIDSCIDLSGRKDVVDYDQIVEKLKSYGATISIDEIKNYKNAQDLKKYCLDKIFGTYEAKVDPFKETVAKVERIVVLKTIDKEWTNQIDQMTKLRDGINLRAYAQNNPLQAYKEEGFIMFDNMMNSIALNVMKFTNNLLIEVENKEKPAE